jgi:acid-sensing ion channel, other
MFARLDPQNKTNCDRCAENLFKMMRSIDSVFEFCQHFKLSENCEDVFERVLTENGVCFTFNGIDVYRQGHDTNDGGVGGSIDAWTLENGYRNESSHLDLYPRTGSKIEFAVILTVQKLRMNRLCERPIQGFKLFLHLPNEAPQIFKHYYLVKDGYINSISVYPQMITIAPELRDFPVQKRQCYFSDERYLRFFRHYTQNNCESECIVNMTMKICGCLRFHMPSGCKISEMEFS